MLSASAGEVFKPFVSRLHLLGFGAIILAAVAH